MLAAVIFLIWFIASHRALFRHAGHRHLSLVGTYCSVALSVFLIAFFMNALGFGRLGFLLGGAMLRSAYLALILYAATAVADGLVIILPYLRISPRLSVVRNHAALLRSRARLICKWAAVILWMYFSLRLLYVASPVMDAVAHFLGKPRHLGGFEMSPDQVIFCVLAIWASFALSRFIRFLLQEDIYPHLSLPRGLGNALSTIIHYGMLVVGFGIAMGFLGVPMTQFTILTGAFGVGLGFGLQTIINNFFSGIIVLAERPIQVGDVIEMDAIVGTVARIGIRATVMRTAEGFGNHPPQRPPRLRTRHQLDALRPETRFRNSHQHRWSGRSAARHPDPAGYRPRPPQCRFKPGASALQVAASAAGVLNFQVRVWATSVDDWKQVRSDVCLAIHAALAKENIAIK